MERDHVENLGEDGRIILKCQYVSFLALSVCKFPHTVSM